MSSIRWSVERVCISLLCRCNQPEVTESSCSCRQGKRRADGTIRCSKCNIRMVTVKQWEARVRKTRPTKKITPPMSVAEWHAQNDIDRFLKEHGSEVRTLVAKFRELSKSKQRDYGIAALVFMSVLQQSLQGSVLEQSLQPKK